MLLEKNLSICTLSTDLVQKFCSFTNLVKYVHSEPGFSICSKIAGLLIFHTQLK